MEAHYAEWWLHQRPHTTGHQLHYDTDEESLRDGRGQALCPIASTIMYLESEVGGPTVIIDQRVGEGHLGARCSLVGPKVNRLAVFDGRLLHGESIDASINMGRRISLTNVTSRLSRCNPRPW